MKSKKYKIKIYNERYYGLSFNLLLLLVGLGMFYLIFYMGKMLNGGEFVGLVILFGVCGIMCIIGAVGWFINRKKRYFREEIIECDRYKILGGKRIGKDI